ncbi:MAG: protein-L-isoaspartate(D-aspartate) O-methyltransferase [Phycisphaera sp.]|nr:protein-L-isoaspartate(D-aspartate) O-methyltransferase [Phycisphaera sp.]
MVQTQLRPRGIHDEAVLRVMSTIPRHFFVPHADLDDAYSDRALPTHEGQTISQPYVVALMTQLLEAQPGVRVLEVGTGSGYQTAILASLGAQVVTVERSRWLSQEARGNLEKLKLAGSVVFIVGDGSLGEPTLGPYDRILVTAAAPRLPKCYLDQLKTGGRIVIPVGDHETQTLMSYDFDGQKVTAQEHIAVRFVPLVGEQGF